MRGTFIFNADSRRYVVDGATSGELSLSSFIALGDPDRDEIWSSTIYFPDSGLLTLDFKFEDSSLKLTFDWLLSIYLSGEAAATPWLILESGFDWFYYDNTLSD